MAPATEAVAIVGMACRLPGATTPARFWQLVRDGEDATSEPPEGRWQDTGSELPSRGGFLDHIAGFDSAFFGVSPREAAMMDPQQRLTLELGWEALEDARFRPDEMRDTQTGVFVGVIADDYTALQNRDPARVSHHSMTGAHRSIIANRLSYTLGLRGPSMAVDTGQSSSLVSVHMACESVRSGETGIAIAGGVNLNIATETVERVARFGGLSPDGRCYTFDARANGYVRGEGGAVVVLKPLRQALADGDRIHCVIRGSAVNNDGATEGLTVPGQGGQEQVLRQAYERAGVEPRDVDFVELHGPGTPAGDPVEAAALGTVLGAERGADTPLPVGSAKTNVGHLEGAAGIVGLLKAALSLHHRALPPSLNFATAHPRIPLDELGLSVQRELRSWPTSERSLTAGVSSFGMGGTNCHLVLGEAPAAPVRRAPAAAHGPGVSTSGSVVPWPVSGRSPQAVRAQAARMHAHVAEHPDLGVADVGFSLAASRAALDHRAVVLGADRAQLLGGLDSLAEGAVAAPNVVRGRATGDGGCVLVFPGQGSQWPGMARELLAESTVFARRMAECEEALSPFVEWSLAGVVRQEEGAPSLERVDVVQPVLWAVMVSLAQVWSSVGARPAAVVGHSQGEIAAACVAGALSLEDGARVVALRSQALVELAGSGGMASVAASADWVAERLPAGVEVAAVNGPAATVIAGEAGAVAGAVATLESAGVRARLVDVDYASHTAQVERVRERVLSGLADVRGRQPDVAFWSTVTGGPVREALDGEYWYQNLRSSVRFAEVIRGLADAGHSVFVEAAPHPVVTDAVTGVLDEANSSGVALGTLRREEGDWSRFLRSAAEVFASGADIDWGRVFAGSAAQLVDLPTYAFQRQRHWLDVSSAAGTAPADAGRAEPSRADNDGDTPQDGAGSQAAYWANMSEPQRRSTVNDLVGTHAAAVLGHPCADSVPATEKFGDLGFDSVMVVEMRTRLAEDTGLRLPATLLFDHPTPAELVEYLHTRLVGDNPRTTDDAAHVPTGDPDEPIAIVAMGCRYPGGVDSPEELWRLVEQRGDTITEFPDDRGWDLEALFNPDPDVPGTTYVRQGGFVEGAAQFDAEFFGISSREAAAMDPQQRLLLEVSWETIERAGIVPSALRGRQVGVFVGATSAEYGPRMREDVPGAGGYVLTGNTTSVASGRLAYVYGFDAPALTIDTACSSSLVAMHQAVQSLHQRECTMALAGGATVMGSPGMFVEFSRQRGLAADGRCKAFAAAADGTAWAEGVGLVLLERLSDARRNGHPVVALVRGSAINQDGASNGLTAPSGPAQQRVITRALTDAGLAAGEVDAVEAHGTGTRLGDPIEAQALLATYGQQRSTAHPVWLGSLKSNIGHSQAAAGVGGVIKMVQAMRHGLVPQTLHADTPSPYVDWSSGGVALATEQVAWPERDEPRRAAVSSFGISGTNAHLIVEEPPTAGAAEEPHRTTRDDVARPDPLPVVPCVLSVGSEAGMRAQATRLRSHLAAHPELDTADAAYSLATTREVLDHRAVVLAEDHAGLVRGLDVVATNDDTATQGAEVVRGHAARRESPVLVFPGQGSQWPEMGRRLLAESAVFAERMAECDQALAAFVDWSLLDVVRGEDNAPSLERVDVVQPVLWAVMVSLAELWRSVGVRPAAVVGHSQGEVAAACVSGALSLEDGAKVAALRSQAITMLAGTGGMLSVAMPVDDVRERLAAWEERLWVAAVNGPATTVVAGDAAALRELAAVCDGDGVRAREIDVDYASHTPHVETIREEVLQRLAGVAPAATEVAFYSTVTGRALEDDALVDADYWFRNLRQPVWFADAVGALVDAGYTTFIEAAPHPVLTGAIEEVLHERGTTGVVVGTLRRDEGDWSRVVRSVAQAWVGGVDVNWSPLVPPGHVVELPTHPFQRRRYWLDNGASTTTAAPAGLEAADHPLLDTATELADGSGVLCTGRISLRTHPWLADHTVAGAVLLPATAFVELALRAGVEVGCDTLGELLLEAPLVLHERGSVSVQVVVEAPEGSERRPFTVHARAHGDDTGPWQRHASGAFESAARSSIDDTGPWPPAATPVGLDDGYQRLAERGYEYGPTFRGLRALWRDGDAILAEVALPDDVSDTAPSFGIHPALLDAVSHALLLASDDDTLRLPFSLNGLTLHATGATQLRARLAPAGGDAVSLVLSDPAGAPVATVDQLVTKPVDRNALATAHKRSTDSLFSLDWVSAPPEPPAVSGARVAVLGDGETGLATQNGPHHRDLTALVTALDLGEPTPDVVFAECPEGQARGLAAATGEVTRHVLELLQMWLADDRFAQSRLVVVTRGAVAATPAEDVARLAQASVWGLVRSAQSEHPTRFTLLDLGGDIEAPDPALPTLAAAIADEPQLAYRGGAGYVPRLGRVRGDTLTGAPELDPQGTVLITGGTGELGALVARRLVDQHGARRLVLLSRSGAGAAGADTLSAELTAMGAHVAIEQCDAADRDSLGVVLSAIPTEHPLTMVVHAAGVLDDATVTALTTEQLDRVLAAKVAGAVNLHELTADQPLTGFVTFSSMMGIVGGPGQGNYAAANTFLDALAQHRGANGTPGLSLAWGLWEADGAITAHLSDADRRRMARDGLTPIPREDGQELFDTALGAPGGIAVPAWLNLAALRARATSDDGVPAVLRGLVGDAAPVPAATAQPATTGEGLAERLAASPTVARHTMVLELVRAQVATVLGNENADSVAPDRAFSELGFDSLTAVELRNRISKATGLRLPATLVFDYPTPDGLARYLLDQLAPEPGSGGGTASLDEIDRLERVLLSMEPDGDTSDQVTARLQALLTKWQDSVGGADAADGHDLEAASDDELFDLLDKELGTS